MIIRFQRRKGSPVPNGNAAPRLESEAEGARDPGPDSGADLEKGAGVHCSPTASLSGIQYPTLPPFGGLRATLADCIENDHLVIKPASAFTHKLRKIPYTVGVKFLSPGGPSAGNRGLGKPLKGRLMSTTERAGTAGARHGAAGPG